MSDFCLLSCTLIERTNVIVTHHLWFVHSLDLVELTANVGSFTDDKIDTVVRRRGRPPKKQNLQGKKLFDEHNSSEDEESVSGSEQEADEEKQDDEEIPLIHSFKSSSKLRSLKMSRES